MPISCVSTKSGVRLSSAVAADAGAQIRPAHMATAKSIANRRFVLCSSFLCSLWTSVPPARFRGRHTPEAAQPMGITSWVYLRGGLAVFTQSTGGRLSGSGERF